MIDNHGRLHNAANRHSVYPSLSRTGVSQAGLTSTRNKSQPRRNDVQVACPLRKDDDQDGLPAREKGSLTRKDEGHEFGDKSRRNGVRSGAAGNP